MDISKAYLKRETRFYLKPVFARKEDGTEGIEVVVDSKPYIKVQDVKAWFCFKKSSGGLSKIDIDDMKFNNSKAIKKALSMVKRSTYKEDKLFLGKNQSISERKCHVINSERH